MADKRINALTTTSASVGDDYFAIDGATNGTRALSAFSPTFGGNATVTGTLSSGGNLSVTSTSAQVILGQSSSSQLTYLIRGAQAGGAIQIVQDALTVNRWLSLGISDNLGVYSELMRVAGATGNILIPGTVASTTTSSGALVVSGGVGVGGNINAGGYLRSINSSAANGSVFDAFRADIGADGTLGALEVKAGGLPSATAGSRYGYILAGDAGAFRKFYVGGTASGGAQVLIPATDTSTTTSSGALVVSGGVGVAKNASIGVNNSTGVLRICDNSFGSDYVVLTTAGTDATGTYGLFISQASGTGLNAPTGQMASLRVNNAAIVSANSAGPILQLTGTAPTLTGNSSLTFEFTSNTSLTLKMRGSDGVTRSASITFS